MKRIACILSLAALSTACSKKEEPAPAPEVAAKAAPAAATPEPAADAPLVGPELAPDEPTTELSEFPVAPDLEDEADRTVVLDNLGEEPDVGLRRCRTQSARSSSGAWWAGMAAPPSCTSSMA